MLIGQQYMNMTFVYDTKNGNVIFDFPNRDDLINDYAWRADSQQLLVCNLAGVHLWDTTNWKNLSSLPEMYGESVSPDWSPDGKYACASGCAEQGDRVDHTSIRIWKLDTRRVFWRLDSQNGVGSLKWSPDGKRVAYSDSDYYVHVLSFPQMNELVKIPANKRFPSQFC
jgi:WD40 repeat protein